MLKISFQEFKKIALGHKTTESWHFGSRFLGWKSVFFSVLLYYKTSIRNAELKWAACYITLVLFFSSFYHVKVKQVHGRVVFVELLSLSLKILFHKVEENKLSKKDNA